MSKMFGSAQARAFADEWVFSTEYVDSEAGQTWNLWNSSAASCILLSPFHSLLISFLSFLIIHFFMWLFLGSRPYSDCDATAEVAASASSERSSPSYAILPAWSPSAPRRCAAGNATAYAFRPASSA